MDWDGATRDQYATLLPRLASRADLSDLMGQLYGEMDTSHTYVWGGDPGVQVPHVASGMLGADLQREGNAYKVTRIYRGDAADRVRSPLDEPGVGVKEGDYILAVDREPFGGDRPSWPAMADLAGKEIQLTVNDKPAVDGSREVTVVPLGQRARSALLRLGAAATASTSAEKTGGKIGYIHLPDMGRTA